MTSADGAASLIFATISTPSFDLYNDLRREIGASTDLAALQDAVTAGDRGATWRVQDGLILKEGRVFIPSTSPLLPVVLNLAHTADHEGAQKTLQRLRAEFYLEHDRRHVRDFVRACSTCQRNKTEALHPAGLLQPLPVPSRI